MNEVAPKKFRPLSGRTIHFYIDYPVFKSKEIQGILCMKGRDVRSMKGEEK